MCGTLSRKEDDTLKQARAENAGKELKDFGIDLYFTLDHTSCRDKVIAESKPEAPAGDPDSQLTVGQEMKQDKKSDSLPYLRCIELMNELCKSKTLTTPI
mmetsp:Transcript_8012/g.11185  ORF Transcript_8012/g.11185 Transcript_8012/m.11185 type:complete len:100 (+) Transcript_8012:57-356(+)